MATLAAPLTPRHFAPDLIRGFAVMGILLMNIIGFAMPHAAYVNPLAWDGGLADRIIWSISFILFDGKMRGLFAMLFGASMLLAMEQAAMTGRDPEQVHRRRMLWLFVFGAAHFLFLWWGDVLMIYAVAGMLAVRFASAEPMSQVKAAFVAFLIQFVIGAAAVAWAYHAQGAAMAPGATATDIAIYDALLDSVSDPSATSIAADIFLHRGGFMVFVMESLRDFPVSLVMNLIFAGIEALGFMLLGMAMLKIGLLSGGWDAQQLKATARHGFLIGILPMLGLTAWIWGSGFATLPTFGSFLAWSLPFRIPMTVGFACLILFALARAGETRFFARVAAAGRMTLSNYLLTSLVMSLVFNGYGLGLFGRLGRPELYGIVVLAWAVMLAWSMPWLRHFRFGPLEWAWRSLVEGYPLPMRRK